MRGRFVLVVSALAIAAFSIDAAELVVLKDGRSIALAKPYTVKGKVAILTLPDKTVLSVPVVEIDKEKTAAAVARAAAPPPAAPAARLAPLTPAEAAKVKNPRKSVVSLTDDSVAHPAGNGETPAASEQGTRVEVGAVSARREKAGYTITGSLMNTGKGEAVAVTLTVEALGDNNRTIASGFASIAKDTLTAGEKTTFTVEIPTEAVAASFNYTPRWKERPSRVSVAGGTAGTESQGTRENEPAGGEGTPPPAPAPKAEEPKTVPRADVAAPPANAPQGQPSEPGGTYVPQSSSSDSQPKLP